MMKRTLTVKAPIWRLLRVVMLAFATPFFAFCAICNDALYVQDLLMNVMYSSGGCARELKDEGVWSCALREACRDADEDPLEHHETVVFLFHALCTNFSGEERLRLTLLKCLNCRVDISHQIIDEAEVSPQDLSPSPLLT